jgi:hypothetical protein
MVVSHTIIVRMMPFTMTVLMPSLAVVQPVCECALRLLLFAPSKYARSGNPTSCRTSLRLSGMVLQDGMGTVRWSYGLETKLGQDASTRYHVPIRVASFDRSDSIPPLTIASSSPQFHPQLAPRPRMCASLTSMWPRLLHPFQLSPF